MTYLPSVVSLFSGAGGFDWGFHRAGYKTLLASELLLGPSKSLSQNFGLKIIHSAEEFDCEVPAVIQGDIRNIDFSKIKLSPDVLIGGPPCQDFSLSQGSQRLGLNGGRGRLYVEFVRAVMFFQPKVFVFENVPGLISANDGLAYKTIKSDLENLDEDRNEALANRTNYLVPAAPVMGYHILFDNIVDAQRLGIPQTRRRLIIIGIRKDLVNNMGELKYSSIKKEFEKTLTGRNMLFYKYPLTCIEVFEGKTIANLNEEYKEIMNAYGYLLRGPYRASINNWKIRVWDKLILDIVKDYFIANQIAGNVENNQEEFQEAMLQHEALLSSLGWLNNPIQDKNFKDLTNILPRQSNKVSDRMNHIPPEENYSFVDGTQWEVKGDNISFIYRRTAPLKPAWTVMAYGGGGTYGYHYARERSQLTLRERARIQTFSDDFLFEGNGTEIRAQIGEAVPPLLGEIIAKLIKDIIN